VQSCKLLQHFVVTCSRHLQGGKWGRYVPLARWQPPASLPRVTTQKTTIRNFSAVRISNILFESVFDINTQQNTKSISDLNSETSSATVKREAGEETDKS